MKIKFGWCRKCGWAGRWVDEGTHFSHLIKCNYMPSPFIEEDEDEKLEDFKAPPMEIYKRTEGVYNWWC